jgi:hypothetical protein
MADIFISYSKADHALALKLSAFLEAEGWSVWWDKSLGAADLYRDEIMKQLVAARAVITIWTPNSIRSDWVRAEAGTAKKEGKLIPVKTADVAYADIPLPFGEMHTENLEASQLIRAAVVAQLAKPAVEPSAWALLSKDLKWELLTWWGIIGGAITLFAAISAMLKLADWARVLVQHWKQWTHGFWVWAFGWLGIHLSPEWTPVLTFLSFGLFLTIGQAFQFARITRNQPFAAKYDSKSFQLKSRRTLFCMSLIIVSLIPIGVRIVVPFMEPFLPDEVFDQVTDWLLDLSLMQSEILGSYRGALTVIEVMIIPPVIVVLFAKHRLHAALSLVLMYIFFDLIMEVGSSGIESKDTGVAAGGTAFYLAWILPLVLLSVAPAKTVSRRLIFLALGLLLLIALNELSKLGLDVTAPKLQG